MKQSFILLVTAVAMSCQSNDHTPETASPENSTENIHDTIPTARIICYAATGKDTVLLKLIISDSSVKGILNYNLYQKDKNAGTLDGKLSGDTLIADYQFTSEGIQSKRQVAFLIQEPVVTEGYGSVEEKNGQMVFKDRRSLNFKNGLILKKVDCK